MLSILAAALVSRFAFFGISLRDSPIIKERVLPVESLSAEKAFFRKAIFGPVFKTVTLIIHKNLYLDLVHEHSLPLMGLKVFFSK